MKAYVAVSAVLFALLAVAHAARLLEEGAGPLRNPMFVASSAIAVAMVAWACVLLLRNAKA